jgi:hypothetical protein
MQGNYDTTNVQDNHDTTNPTTKATTTNVQDYDQDVHHARFHTMLSHPLTSGGSSLLMSGRSAAGLMSASFTKPCWLQSPMHRSARVDLEERWLRM